MKTETVSLTLEEVLPALGNAYKEWKTSERAKNDRKDEFFALADAELIERGLAMKVVEIEASDESIARERTRLHYPGWLIDELRKHRTQAGVYDVVIMENPSKKSFSHEYEGVKYSRSVRKGAVMVDDEWLKESDPELYAEVTFELPWGARVLRPIEKMEGDMLTRLARYVYNGNPVISLAAPKPVKEEE